MGASLFTGPDLTVGPMLGIPGVVPEYSADFGPGITYQGDALPDIRYTVNKDNILPGSVRAHMNYPYILSVDAVPAALGAANLAAAQTATSGTALTLAAASTGIVTNIPIYPFQSGVLVTAAIGVDFGFDTVNCSAGNAVVTPADMTKYTVGMPVCIANVGNAGATSALLTYVTKVGTSTITLASAPLATNASARIGTGNMWGPQGLSSNQPTAAQPYIAAGVGLFQDPYQSITRGWRVVSNNAGETGWTVTATGYDLYGRLQTETLAVTANGTTWGKKTFKYFMSFMPTKSGSTAGTLSIGTSDVFGVAVRNDKWEYDNFYWAGAFLVASTGWTAADQTTPATSSTGDVRGTIQLGSNGPLGSGATGGASNGTLRLALFSTVPFYNLTQANPSNTSPFYGVTPA